MPILAILIIAVIASAWVYVDKNKTDKSLSRETADPDSTLVETLPDNIIAVEKLKELVTKTEAPGTIIASVRLEKADGVLYYVVELPNGKQLIFNAQTGAKVTKDIDDDDEQDEANLPADFAGGIGFAKAQAIAQGQRPSSVIRKVELELEDGKVVYSVRFTDKSRVDVDAKNGTIVRVKIKTEKESKSDSKKSGSSTSSDDDSNDNKDEAEDSGDSSGSGSGSSGSNSGSGSDDSDND